MKFAVSNPKLMFCVHGQPLLYLESTRVTSKCPQINVSIKYVNTVQKYLSGKVPKTVLLMYVYVTVKFPPRSCSEISQYEVHWFSISEI